MLPSHFVKYLIFLRFHGMIKHVSKRRKFSTARFPQLTDTRSPVRFFHRRKRLHSSAMHSVFHRPTEDTTWI